jgi:FlaA1/EpsC-like NDP-sugar epimerase
MGEPIPLAEIIENLQFVLDHRSSVLVTGLRDGEKMSEDLFGSTEESFTTSEPRIKCANLSIELNKNMKLLNQIIIRNESSINTALSAMTTLKTH